MTYSVDSVAFIWHQKWEQGKLPNHLPEMVIKTTCSEQQFIYFWTKGILDMFWMSLNTVTKAFKMLDKLKDSENECARESLVEDIEEPHR